MQLGAIVADVVCEVNSAHVRETLSFQEGLETPDRHVLIGQFNEPPAIFDEHRVAAGNQRLSGCLRTPVS